MIHSGCVLNDGSVYQWGTCADYQSINRESRNAKEYLQKAICQFPCKVAFKNCGEQSSTQTTSSISARRKSTQDVGEESSPMITELRMGEQFTIALSMRGYVYTWGMNDKGQLGLGFDGPTFDPAQVPQIGPTSKH